MAKRKTTPIESDVEEVAPVVAEAVTDVPVEEPTDVDPVIDEIRSVIDSLLERVGKLEIENQLLQGMIEALPAATVCPAKFAKVCATLGVN